MGSPGGQVEDSDFACDAFHSIDVICSGARRRFGVGGIQYSHQYPARLLLCRHVGVLLTCLVCVCVAERGSALLCLR